MISLCQVHLIFFNSSSIKSMVHLYQLPIESIKTTSMEDVSTRVLEKIKNISEGKTEK